MKSVYLVAQAAALLTACADLSPASGSATDATASDAAAAANCAFDGDATQSKVIFQDVFADPQYALESREPALGATVCGAVEHRWTFVAKGLPPMLYIGLGPRHTAGDLPPGPYTTKTYDQHTFFLNKPIIWPGPGTHVQMEAYNSKGKLILDPYFEYDLVPIR